MVGLISFQYAGIFPDTTCTMVPSKVLGVHRYIMNHKYYMYFIFHKSDNLSMGRFWALVTMILNPENPALGDDLTQLLLLLVRQQGVKR